MCLTQLTLYLGFSVVGLPAAVANLVAVCVAAWPAYLLNRRWVWLKRATHSLTREVVPFWAYNFAGLASSTLLVALADRYLDGSALAVQAANLMAFGGLWLGKFLLLDRVLFAVHADVA